MEPLSQRILRENAGVFDRMVRHRFVQDIKADRLAPEVFDRYLVIEGAFVDTAIAIFALAVAKASGIEDQRWLIRVLDALANDQVAYFERVLAARRITPDPKDLDDPRVAAFRAGMLAIAETGSFEDIVAAMFAAEWMYWTWCSAANARHISDPEIRDWVRLHAEPAFAGQAAWLRDRLDRAGTELSDAAQTRLVHVFENAQNLEIAFHDAAYGRP